MHEMERTCRPEVCDDGAGAWGVYCSECDYRFAGTCGKREVPEHMATRRDIMPRYCPSCGARVELDNQLTHTKPEPPDTWERIEEDKGLNPFDYCKKVGHKLWTFDNAEEFKASDLVRRCRALAERG